jgi:hypothetical protein
MAQIVKDRLQLRMRIIGRDPKQLRAMLYNRKHSHTTRDDLDHDVAIFYGDDTDGDVTPLLYGAKAIPGIKPNFELDMKWIKEYNELPNTFLKVGIGRGAQFLNVMSGGALWQKVTGNHQGSSCSHDVKLLDTGELIVCHSDHKSMMRPGLQSYLIGVAKASVTIADDEEVMETPLDGYRDPEIVYYEHTNSLCFQPTPWLSGATYREKFFGMIEEQYSHLSSGA